MGADRQMESETDHQTTAERPTKMRESVCVVCESEAAFKAGWCPTCRHIIESVARLDLTAKRTRLHQVIVHLGKGVDD